MIIVDTNVLSEWLRNDADPNVVGWYTAQSATDVYVTTISEAEMWFGANRLPHGRKRAALSSSIAALFDSAFADRRLAFDSSAARGLADMVAERGLHLKLIDLFDAQIAAIALAHSATLATRNTKHFSIYGVDLIDPWQTVR